MKLLVIIMLSVLALQRALLADVYLTASIRNDKLILKLDGEEMTTGAFFEQHATSLVRKSENESVCIILNPQFPVGKITEVSGLIDKIGVRNVKYYVASDDNLNIVELVLKGPARKNPTAKAD